MPSGCRASRLLGDRRPDRWLINGRATWSQVSRAARGDDCGDPMKGGLRIEPRGSERWCTSGFIGRASGSNPPDYRVIMAGPCAEHLGGIDTMWQRHEEYRARYSRDLVLGHGGRRPRSPRRPCACR
jgi:hypothetical protein